MVKWWVKVGIRGQESYWTKLALFFFGVQAAAILGPAFDRVQAIHQGCITEFALGQVFSPGLGITTRAFLGIRHLSRGG